MKKITCLLLILLCSALMLSCTNGSSGSEKEDETPTGQMTGVENNWNEMNWNEGNWE